MTTRHAHFRLFAIVILTVAALSACVTMQGKTPEARADALYAKFTIAEARGAALIKDASVPDHIKQAIQDADREASPVIEEMDAASVGLSRLRIEKPEDVPGAINALNEIITRATPLVSTYQRRVAQ
jgi:hypothetical protein